MLVLEIILWILIGCCLYTLIAYPLLMLVLSRVIRYRFIREPITPSVSLIIAAYNEEKSIAGKLENSLAVDYPGDKLEIIVASDASTDRTDEIVRGFADRGVKLFRLDGNQGKSEVINEAVKHATGEILVFSDATGHWSRASIREMASHYADPRVGGVYGWVAYRYGSTVSSQGFAVYQRYVMALRRCEAAFGAGFNAPGSIHSVRSSTFVPTPAETFSDMTDPLHTAMQGLRTTFEEKAVSLEESRTRASDEFRARVRIATHAWAFMLYSLRRFPLLRSSMYCFQLASHKFIRWLIGPFMILIFAVNAVLLSQHWVYQVLFAGQLAYYALVVLGYLARRWGLRVPGISGLVFFTMVNLAYVVAGMNFLRGRRVARWRPSR